MFAVDILRSGRVHRAYWLWLVINLPFAVAVHVAWDKPWWHAAARQMLGV